MKSPAAVRKAILRAAVLFVTLTSCIPAIAFGDVRVWNVRFEIEENKIIILYDLAGSRDEEYNIVVVLKKEGDQTFKYVPKDLQGDAGVGKFSGPNRRIVWNLSKEFPQGLDAGDYYFEVNAQEISSTSNELMWLGAGAAVIGAGITALLILNKSPMEDPKRGGEFPLPPGRP